MRHVSTAVTALLAMSLGATGAFGDATTSPGKAAVYVSKLIAPISVTGFPISGTIAKGKRRRVLEVDLSATDLSANHPAIIVSASVNGVVMEPSSLIPAGSTCNGGFVCTIASQWWLDLDAAEAAHPGMFINQPLNIQGTVFAAMTPSTADVSLRARLQKK